MSNAGLPSEMAAALDPSAPTAGAEAAAQSDVAKAGLIAWKRVQALGGERPEMDDLKAMLMYVLTEGMAAPQAAEMAAYLKDKGVSVPGMAEDPSGLSPEMEGPMEGSAMPPEAMG